MKIFIPSFKTQLVSLLFIFCFLPQPAGAWGKRGHSIVCQTAAYLTARDPKADFMKSWSFDLGYYCNVPDILWKKPATYDAEWYNHFMDLEVFDRELKESDVEHPFELDRITFNAKFPEINNAAGRAWWRVREIYNLIEGIVTDLKKTNLSIRQKHESQTEWLSTAGVLGHYIGDLANPLHVTENFDGQLTGQRGIHAFFEDDLVDELFNENGTHLEGEVQKAAEEKWLLEEKLALRYEKAADKASERKPSSKAKNQEKLSDKIQDKPLEKLSVLELLEILSQSSSKNIPALLATDKRVGRSDLRKAAAAHHAMLVERMAEGAVILAELWKRQLGWEFIAKNYHGFDPSPEFIIPPKAGSAH